jgi:hypothetical protein
VSCVNDSNHGSVNSERRVAFLRRVLGILNHRYFLFTQFNTHHIHSFVSNVRGKGYNDNKAVKGCFPLLLNAECMALTRLIDGETKLMIGSLLPTLHVVAP